MKTKDTALRQWRWSVDEARMAMYPSRPREELVQDEMKRLLSRRVLSDLTYEEWNQIYDAAQLILQVRNRYKKNRS